MQDRLRVVEQFQAERPDDETGREIPKHRAQAQALEDGHRHHAGREQRDDLDEIVSGNFGGHVCSSLVSDELSQGGRPRQPDPEGSFGAGRDVPAALASDAICRCKRRKVSACASVASHLGKRGVHACG